MPSLPNRGAIAADCPRIMLYRCVCERSRCLSRLARGPWSQLRIDPRVHWPPVSSSVNSSRLASRNSRPPSCPECCLERQMAWLAGRLVRTASKVLTRTNATRSTRKGHPLRPRLLPGALQHRAGGAGRYPGRGRATAALHAPNNVGTPICHAAKTRPFSDMYRSRPQIFVTLPLVDGLFKDTLQTAGCSELNNPSCCAPVVLRLLHQPLCAQPQWQAGRARALGEGKAAAAGASAASTAATIAAHAAGSGRSAPAREDGTAMQRPGGCKWNWSRWRQPAADVRQAALVARWASSRILWRPSAAATTRAPESLCACRCRSEPSFRLLVVSARSCRVGGGPSFGTHPRPFRSLPASRAASRTDGKWSSPCTSARCSPTCSSARPCSRDTRSARCGRAPYSAG
jgi:hypothetical protein